MKKILILILLCNYLSAHNIIYAAQWLTRFNIENCKALGRAFIPETALEHMTQPENEQKFNFSNLAGTVSEEVKEIADFIKDAQKYAAMGARMPKGILLYGPPGTGKTSLARALAGETQAAFFAASGSQFIEMYVGVGPSRIRELFTKARTALANGAPAAIIFIDEIDAIGGKREFEGSSEYRNTLNELLAQLDGFNKDEHIFIIAATNNVNMLDAALIRPGRFDRHIKIDLPNEADRQAILIHFIEKTQHQVSLKTLEKVAHDTHQFSPPELENMINECAIMIVRQKRTHITDADVLAQAAKMIEQKRNSRK